MSNNNDEVDVRKSLGGIAKRYKKVYDEFRKEAELQGLSTQEALVEALEMWRLATAMEDIDPKALIAGYRLALMQLKNAVQILQSLGGIWTSEYFQTQMQLLNELNKQREDLQQKIRDEVRQELEAIYKQPTPSGQTVGQVMNQLPADVRNVLQQALTNIITNTLAKALGVTAPQTGNVNIPRPKVVTEE